MSGMIKKSSTHYLDQDGFVSIIVTMIIMFILTLIVLGFAQLSRREARQALDRQLSQQAYYAAESGINDAYRAINAGYDQEKTTCGPLAGGTTATDPLKNNIVGNGVEYSCLLISQKLPTYEFSDIATDKSTVLPIKLDSGGAVPVPVNDIIVSWQKVGGASNSYPASLSGFPPAWKSPTGTPYDVGILRLDLIPVDGALDRDALITSTKTIFLYPTNNAGVGSAPVRTESGSIETGNCNGTNTPKTCRISIGGILGGSLTHTKYFMRLKSIYLDNEVSICPTSDGATCDSTKNLIGGQIEIDSTGKAQDVLKRINTRIANPSSSKSTTYPENAFQSMESFCKLFDVFPGGGTDNCAASGGGGSPLTGLADFGAGCGAAICNWSSNPPFMYTDANDSRRWTVDIENHTSNPGLTNVSCVWTFSDGSPNRTDKCQLYDSFQKSFAVKQTCESYTVTLVVKFSNNTTSLPQVKTYRLPDNNPLPVGYQFSSPCPNN